MLHILILHQTTTNRVRGWHCQELLHILILHQTTTYWELPSDQRSCFIFWFYIKPQQFYCFHSAVIGCFIFWFYIKPQLHLSMMYAFFVASYFDSTSNHNYNQASKMKEELLHILILHQTTTKDRLRKKWNTLLHILILHQTTTFRPSHSSFSSCFIFWFYIKPQPEGVRVYVPRVASYFDSTSNHNVVSLNLRCCQVASYFDSTSNHNSLPSSQSAFELLHILILHQTTT